MHRLLAELDQLDAYGGAPRCRKPDPGTWTRRLVATAVALTLFVAITGMFAHKQYGLTLTSEGFQLPERLAAPPVATGTGSFAYMQTQRGDRPVAYDPCRPIEYVVNDSLAPGGADRLLDSALEEMSAATGLVFRYSGNTEDLPQRRPAAITAKARPVLIAWTTPEEVPDLDGDIAGVAGSAARAHDLSGDLRYVTGMVALDAPQLREILSRPMGAEQVRAIILHELGHLVGLAHVEDSRELMFADNVGMLGLGSGDRQGLAALGQGDCFP